MRTVLRLAARVVMLAIVCALFIGITEFFAASIHPPTLRFAQRERHREPMPELRVWPKFIWQGALYGLIGLGGRVILRLRL